MRGEAMRGLRVDVMLTLGAVLCFGFAAGRLVSPTMYVATALAALLVWRGTRATGINDPRSDDLGFIPNDLRPRVQETLARCGDSAARSLLGVIAQARPLLTRERPQLDERAERETRENVLSLLEACCATAQSLTDLDRALAAAPENVNASPRALQVRQRLADQLARAATTLGDLYVAGLEQETDALSQVSQLTAAIHEDAEGRRTAMEEIRRVVAG